MSFAPSTRRLFQSTSSSFARRPNRRDASGDGLDMSNFGEFAFPLARPAILKQELRRQFLHYLRLEQFQFGSLVAFRQKFNKPSPGAFIKVRHQHYQGELHPASRKVDITFNLKDVPLKSEAARHKFALLAGPRLNHVTGEVKIACERFPTEQMNEKWCSDTLDKIIKEAEDSKDSMADIPVDTRSTTARLAKKTAKGKRVTLNDFPKEWLPQPAVDAPSAGVGAQGGAQKVEA